MLEKWVLKNGITRENVRSFDFVKLMRRANTTNLLK
jgi:hypothetical protein